MCVSINKLHFHVVLLGNQAELVQPGLNMLLPAIDIQKEKP